MIDILSNVVDLLPQLAIAWLPLLSALPALAKAIKPDDKGEQGDGPSDGQMSALSSLLASGALGNQVDPPGGNRLSSTSEAPRGGFGEVYDEDQVFDSRRSQPGRIVPL